MGWKCVETVYHSDCPLPLCTRPCPRSAHWQSRKPPGHAGDFSILHVIFSHLQLAAPEVVESFLFLLGLGKLVRSPACLFVNAQLLGAPHS